MIWKDLKSLKRSGYLEWDEYYMIIALLQVRRGVNKRAVDGAIILDEGKLIVSTEYGFPGINTSNPHVSHAEFKAVQNIGKGETGHVMYTTSFPCSECAETIIKAGICEIIYCHEHTKTDAAAKIFDKHGVVYRKYITDKEKVEINFSKFRDGNDNNDDDDGDSDFFEMPSTSLFD